MHGITSITSHSVAPPSQMAGMNVLPTQSGTDFQVSVFANLANQFVLRGISPTTTPSLGARTLSALLQTQDINQTQPPGSHGGGGGHHGINQTPGLEAEAAAENEEAQLLRRRKKLVKALQRANASETAEDGKILSDNVEQTAENQPDKKAA